MEGDGMIGYGEMGGMEEPEMKACYTKKDEGPIPTSKYSTVSSIPYSQVEGRLLIVKVGSQESPASQKDIDNMDKQLKKILKGVNCQVLVTHHAVQFEIL